MRGKMALIRTRSGIGRCLPNKVESIAAQISWLALVFNVTIRCSSTLALDPLSYLCIDPQHVYLSTDTLRWVDFDHDL